MNKSEYWLLDIAVKSYQPLSILASENLEEILNRKQRRDLSFVALSDTLQHMFHRRDIFATQWSRDLFARDDTSSLPFKQISEAFVPNRQEIEAALQGEMAISYGLTSQGGERWEVVSQPNWERYSDETYGDDSPYEGEIIAGGHQILEDFLSCILLSPLYNYLVIPESVMWDTIAPWQATYWKTLPIGYRIRFHYIPKELESGASLEEKAEGMIRADNLRQWYTNYLEE